MKESLWPLVLGALAANALTVLAIYASLAYRRGSLAAAKLVSDTTQLGFGAYQLIAWVVGMVFVFSIATRTLADWYRAGGAPAPTETGTVETSMIALATTAPMDEIMWSILIGALAANALTALTMHAVHTHRPGFSVAGTAKTLYFRLTLFGLKVYTICFALFVLDAIYFGARQWIAHELNID